MAAAAMAKVVLRGGRSGSSTSSLIAAMHRRVTQEGVAGAQLLGSSPAASRLMHSGQWRNSMLLGGNGSKLAEHKIMRTRRFSGKRFMSDVPFRSGYDYPAWLAVGVFGVFSVGLTLPMQVRRLSRYLKE